MREKKTFATMNGLRGVAALVVVAFHWSLRDVLPVQFGWLAVDLFFVLSGFVIAHAYSVGLESGKLSFGRFLLIRLIRFYPLYLVGTALAIVASIASWISHGEILDTNRALYATPFAILMLPDFGNVADGAASLYPLNGPAWSLWFELLINVAYAASIRFWTIARLVVLVTAAGAVLLWNVASTGSLFGEGGWNWGSFPLGLLRVLFSFSAGVLIYKLYAARLRLPALPSVAILGCFPALLWMPEPIIVPFSVLIAFPALVAAAAFSEPRDWSLRVFTWLGTASYGIYAIHVPFHRIVGVILEKLAPSLNPLLVDGTLFALILPIVLLLDRHYDTPLRKALERLTAVRKTVPAAP